MKNIEIYEFFNLGNKEREKKFKIIHSDKNGLVLECEFFDGCLDILPAIALLEKPESGVISSIIIFFSKGEICAGFDTGSQTVVSDNPLSVVDQNVFEFINQFNVHI
jgi:hypothetical protein